MLSSKIISKGSYVGSCVKKIPPQCIPIVNSAFNVLANSNASTGDDTYSLDSSTLNGWNCIWDNGGQDVITAVGQTDSVSINLQNATLDNSLGGGGFISRLGTQNIGYLIAYNSTGNCVIENAIGGLNNDTLTGNEYDNNLYVVLL